MTNDRHLLLHVRLQGDTARILGGRTARRGPPSRKSRPVRVTGDNWFTFPLGTREFVYAFHRADGSCIRAHGEAIRPLVFGHSEDPSARGALRGGHYVPEFDDRYVHVTVPADAATLGLYRTETARAGGSIRPHADRIHGGSHETERDWVLTPLAVYPFEVSEPDTTTRLSLAWPVPGLDRRVTVFPLRIFDFPELTWEREAVDPDMGVIDGDTMLHESGPVEERYNIVITGDGFSAAERGLFDERARTFTKGLLDMTPFAGLRDRINVHAVRAMSTDSGVSHCPTGSGLKRTYYGFKGYFRVEKDDPVAEGYCGTPYPGRIFAAVERRMPREFVQLIVMLINARVYGGGAFYPLDLAVVTLADREEDFVNVGAHECGHAIANLGEEYISFVPWDALSECPNIVPASRSRDVWWKSLARPDELSEDGHFAVVRRYDGSRESCVHNTWKIPDTEEFRKLGLFWGSQYIDETADADTDVSELDPASDPRGRHYYRGMARCRMRATNWDFCRVCAHAMADIIRDPWR